MQEESTTPIKLVVVGDAGVGKTSTLISYTANSFPREYVPRVYDNLVSSMMVDGKVYNISFWDTAGAVDFEKIRVKCYPESHVIILMFDVTKKSTFDSIDSTFLPEVQKECKQAKFLLVGNKIDNSPRQVSKEEAKKYASRNSMEYFEISAQSQEGLKILFDQVVRIGAPLLVNSKQSKGSSSDSKKKGCTCQ
ncbi:rho family small GTPase [Naegleria gruberi]|uniref:Rho family small GTPase n=1 Tax=Naegleria gruberi TaxID=5762 RepID=D2VBW1_NAEGR|nr:rho family small GTPase [Naegleria gruberi]EFC45544.1 rho family small GTPase [Naegleria gruberi]|eukprot:XP_002678288.1 rho family small GTPase [Naegleria gruberi strain NEG-M]